MESPEYEVQLNGIVFFLKGEGTAYNFISVGSHCTVGQTLIFTFQ